MLNRRFDDMRVDEKEDWLYELCEGYRLHVEYSWGVYYIGFRMKLDEYGGEMSAFQTIILTRSDIETIQLEAIEEMVLGYVLEHGL